MPKATWCWFLQVMPIISSRAIKRSHQTRSHQTEPSNTEPSNTEPSNGAIKHGAIKRCHQTRSHQTRFVESVWIELRLAFVPVLPIPSLSPALNNKLFNAQFCTCKMQHYSQTAPPPPTHTHSHWSPMWPSKWLPKMMLTNSCDTSSYRNSNINVRLHFGCSEAQTKRTAVFWFQYDVIHLVSAVDNVWLECLCSRSTTILSNDDTVALRTGRLALLNTVSSFLV
jgi:hypothetical protein